MIEQSADVGVVQGLGGGRVAVGGSDLRIGHESLHQRFQMRVLEAGDEIAERLPQLDQYLWWSLEGNRRTRFRDSPSLRSLWMVSWKRFLYLLIRP